MVVVFKNRFFTKSNRAPPQEPAIGRHRPRLFAGGEASPLRVATGGSASWGSKPVAAARPPPANNTARSSLRIVSGRVTNFRQDLTLGGGGGGNIANYRERSRTNANYREQNANDRERNANTPGHSRTGRLNR